MNNSRFSWLFDLTLLAIFIAVFYGIALGSHPLLLPDEGRYSEIIREMVLTSDYITPRVNNIVFLDKPILFYWLGAIAVKLFGLSEWTLRLWPALLGSLTCLYIYTTSRLLFNRLTGILSALVLATSLLYFMATHYVNMDLTVAGFISMSLLSLIVGIQSKNNKQRIIFLLLAYFFTGLAVLTKGLIGLAFPIMILGSWIIILNNWKLLRHLLILLGLLIIFLINFPWYFLSQQANPDFLHYFFVVQHFYRFLTKGFNNQQPIWFYLPIILLGLLPWSVFLYQTLTKNIKAVWHTRFAHQTELFLLLWAFLVFIFFSIPVSKTVGYILPAIPPLALLIGNYLSIIWNQDIPKSFRSPAIIYITVALVLAISFFMVPYIYALPKESHLIPYILLMTIIYFSSAVITIFYIYRGTNIAKLFHTMFITAVLAAITIVFAIQYAQISSTKALSIKVYQSLKPDDEVIAYYQYYEDLPFYTQRYVSIVNNWNQPPEDQEQEIWHGLNDPRSKSLLIDEITFWKRWFGKKRLFVVAEKIRYPELKTNAKGKFFLLDTHDDQILVSNKPNQK